MARLYLLCFAYHRFRQINDNLIEAFIHLLDQYEKDAKLSAQAAAQQAMFAANQNLNAAGKVLKPIEETLATLREEIEARFVSVNKRIEDGSNKHIKVTGVGAKRRWTLAAFISEAEQKPFPRGLAQATA
jgi:hypothetical protein